MKKEASLYELTIRSDAEACIGIDWGIVGLLIGGVIGQLIRWIIRKDKNWIIRKDKKKMIIEWGIGGGIGIINLRKNQKAVNKTIDGMIADLKDEKAIEYMYSLKKMVSKIGGIEELKELEELVVMPLVDIRKRFDELKNNS